MKKEVLEKANQLQKLIDRDKSDLKNIIKLNSINRLTFTVNECYLSYSIDSKDENNKNIANVLKAIVKSNLEEQIEKHEKELNNL